MTLLSRSTRRVDLTPAGEIFLEHAQRVLEGVRQACRAALRADAGATRSLTIAFDSSVTCGLLPRLARTFRASHPGIGLTLHSEMVARAQLQAMEQREIDVGFLRLQVRPANLQTEVLRRDRLIAVLPEHDALAGRERLALEDFAAATFIPVPGGVVRASLVAADLSVPKPTSSQVSTAPSLTTRGLATCQVGDGPDQQGRRSRA